jgi:hypothetical protein
VSESQRMAEVNRATKTHETKTEVKRGYMIATVTGLTRDQAKAVRAAFQREGWSATAKNGYTQVRAERKV